MSEAIAREALVHWGLQDASLTLIAQRENVVYRIDDALTGQTWALRVHRKGLRSKAELTSESQWLQALSENGLDVPVPVASQHGTWCIQASEHWVDLQHWLPGDTIEQHAEPQRYKALGQTIARLHRVSDEWTTPIDFKRPAWDCDGLLGDHPVWGRFWENPELDQQQMQLLQRFRSAATTQLNKHNYNLDYGLIHADLVSENVLVDDQQLQLIDFDDSGFGYRLFDLATVILRLQRGARWEVLAKALLEGYNAERTLDSQALDLFLALRACTYIGWIIPRRQEPGSSERCARFINTGCLHVERWLIA